MYLVSDLMSRDVVTIGETEDLSLADSILALGRIRHLPVMRGDQLVGLVTHRDVLRAFGGHGAAVPAGSVMQRKLVTVRPDSPLRDAAQTMLDQKLGCVLVTEGERLVGILTEADLVRFALDVIRDLEIAAQELSPQ